MLKFLLFWPSDKTIILYNNGKEIFCEVQFSKTVIKKSFLIHDKEEVNMLWAKESSTSALTVYKDFIGQRICNNCKQLLLKQKHEDDSGSNNENLDPSYTPPPPRPPEQYVHSSFTCMVYDLPFDCLYKIQVILRVFRVNLYFRKNIKLRSS